MDHITPAVSCVMNYVNLTKLELEHMKTQLEQVLGDEYVPMEFGSDLSSTGSEQEEDEEKSPGESRSEYGSDSQSECDISQSPGQAVLPPVGSILPPITSQASSTSDTHFCWLVRVSYLIYSASVSPFLRGGGEKIRILCKLVL